MSASSWVAKKSAHTHTLEMNRAYQLIKSIVSSQMKCEEYFLYIINQLTHERPSANRMTPKQIITNKFINVHECQRCMVLSATHSEWICCWGQQISRICRKQQQTTWHCNKNGATQFVVNWKTQFCNKNPSWWVIYPKKKIIQKFPPFTNGTYNLKLLFRNERKKKQTKCLFLNIH